MNRNIKKIIAMTLTICAVSSVGGSKSFSLLGEGTLAAFASDKSSLNLESISLSTGSIDFSSDVTSYKVYYNRSVKDIDIKVSPEGSDKRIRVTINDESVSSDDNYKDNFKLSIGENIFKIKVENKDDESQSKTYTLKAYRGTDENGEEIEQDLYLSYLTVNGEDIALSKDKKVYDYKVDDDVKEAKVMIEPDQDYYTVKINNDKTYEGEESIKKTFTLTKGKNEIKIKLTDGDDDEKKQRTYTLNIYRGIDIPTSSTTTDNTTSTENSTNNSDSIGTTGSSSTTTNTSVDSNVSDTGKWQQTSTGKWYYVDSNGNVAKNKWFFVQSDGTMATGWISFGGSWYYLNADGTMATGWLNSGGKWYYLGSDGVMKTGWVEVSGKWYYLYSDGSMASNASIDGYRLASDGAWIK